LPSSDEVCCEELAENVVDYIRTRYHTEAPHISVLEPEKPQILRRIFRRRQTIERLPPEIEEELDAETFSDILDPTRIRGSSVFGVRSVFSDYTDQSRVKFFASFYYRVSPRADFRRVDVTVDLEGKTDVILEVRISTESGEDVSSFRRHHVFKQGHSAVVFAVGRNDVSGTAAQIISRTLYAGRAEVSNVDEPAILRLLSTLPRNGEGRSFIFTPKAGSYYARSDRHFAVQNFCVEVSANDLKNNEFEVSFVLRYIAPALVDRRTERLVHVGESGFPRFVCISREHRTDRWSVHHLLEIEGALKWYGCRKSWGWKRTFDQFSVAGLYNLTPIGCLAFETDDNALVLRDWHIQTEEVLSIISSGRSLRESFDLAVRQAERNAALSSVNLDSSSLRGAADIIAEALLSINPGFQLYSFQEQSLIEGLASLTTRAHRVIVLQARTAGGKTLAFLLPLLTWILSEKLSGEQRLGAKAVLMYPTVALQNDQASTIQRILWEINNRLRAIYGDKSPQITMGLLHQYTPRRADGGGGVRNTEELRLSCPICSGRLILNWRQASPSPDHSFFMELIGCSNPSCIINQQGREWEVLQSMLKTSREAIYSEPPDLLIISPDMINTRLSLSGRNDPASLSILGKEVFVCTQCGTPYDYRGRPRRCRVCNGSSFMQIRPEAPSVVVVDEAHLFRGAFGAQVSHVLTRMEEVVRRLSGRPRGWRPVYFISSATLSNPVRRAQELTAAEEEVTVISAREESRGREPAYRVHVFIMPKTYSPQATTSRIAEALYGQISAVAPSYLTLLDQALRRARRVSGIENPTTLIFVNRLAESNELLNHIRSYIPRNVRSDGHTTDYSRERIRIEDEFSRGLIDLIVATRGLEVGVDFERINVGMIYGMPYFLSDYTQRIGRIGRGGRAESRHCIIFNIFMPDKPIDHFYFRNWKLLSDGELRELHMENESYRLRRENPEVVRRSARRAVFDLISIQPGAQRLLSANHQVAVATLNNLAAHLTGYVQSSLALPSQQNSMAVAEARQFMQDLIADVGQYGSIRRVLNRRRNDETFRYLRSLRSTEQRVHYVFENSESRERDLIYGFRHSLRGQVVSYRTNCFSVSMSEKEPIDIYPH